MNIRQKKIYVVIEITDPYIDDEDYSGLESEKLLDRHSLAKILEEDCYYPTRQWVRLVAPPGIEYGDRG